MTLRLASTMLMWPFMVLSHVGQWESSKSHMKTYGTILQTYGPFELHSLQYKLLQRDGMKSIKFGREAENCNIAHDFLCGRANAYLRRAQKKWRVVQSALLFIWRPTELIIIEFLWNKISIHHWRTRQSKHYAIHVKYDKSVMCLLHCLIARTQQRITQTRTLAPELRALITILRSGGPVISTRLQQNMQRHSVVKDMNHVSKKKRVGSYQDRVNKVFLDGLQLFFSRWEKAQFHGFPLSWAWGM